MEGGILESPESTLGSSLDDFGERGCCSPKRFPFRLTGLMLMCLLGFGSYFCYDNPAALQDNFFKDLGMVPSKFVLLYSIYSWPNVILCFVGGFLLDNVFGIRLGTVIYMAITMIGQFVFALGGLLNTFWLMMVGRFVFGIGAESLAVAQNSYAVLWFKGKELNMVFGFQMSFARLGSTVNFLVMEPMYSYVSSYYTGATCIGIVLCLAALTCVGSMICAVILAVLDKRMEKVLRRGEGEEPQVGKIKDVKEFSGVFWLVAFICIAYYVAIFPFIALGKVFFIRKYGYDPNAANAVNSLLYIIAAVVSPLAGILVDKAGKNILWVVLSILGTILAHTLLTFTFVSPYVCMVLMGLMYSMLASSLWPLIALIIPEYQLGTAYGIAQALQNFGLAVTSIVTGLIVEKGGYFMLEIFFLACLWISLITAIVIWVWDGASTGGLLNMTPSQRDEYNAERGSIDIVEREQLLSSVSTAEFSADDLLQSQTDMRSSTRKRW